jgi:hypothetical protein
MIEWINPFYSLEILLQAEMPANPRTCSIFVLTVGVTTIASKNLARVPLYSGTFIGLSAFITNPNE